MLYNLAEFIKKTNNECVCWLWFKKGGKNPDVRWGLWWHPADVDNPVDDFILQINSLMKLCKQAQNKINACHLTIIITWSEKLYVHIEGLDSFFPIRLRGYRLLLTVVIWICPRALSAVLFKFPAHCLCLVHTDEIGEQGIHHSSGNISPARLLQARPARLRANWLLIERAPFGSTELPLDRMCAGIILFQEPCRE